MLNCSVPCGGLFASPFLVVVVVLVFGWGWALGWVDCWLVGMRLGGALCYC